MIRFYDKVSPEPTSGCHLWMAATQVGGYGLFQYEGRLQCAHRVAVQLMGMTVDGKVVRHTCDNPSCVNPDHLVIGTQKENIQDALRRRRKQVGTQCGHSKLNEKQVRAIRAMRDEGNTWVSIAETLELKQHLVDDVLRGKTYNSVI